MHRDPSIHAAVHFRTRRHGMSVAYGEKFSVAARRIFCAGRDGKPADVRSIFAKVGRSVAMSVSSVSLSPAAIALNRFGLGNRPEDTPLPDPKGWLAGQFDSFEVRPVARGNGCRFMAKSLMQFPQLQSTASGKKKFSMDGKRGF
jgi:hypothetical protein